MLEIGRARVLSLTLFKSAHLPLPMPVLLALEQAQHGAARYHLLGERIRLLIAAAPQGESFQLPRSRGSLEAEARADICLWQSAFAFAFCQFRASV